MFFKETNAHDLLSSFLLPGETLLWSGQPLRGSAWTTEDIIVLVTLILLFPVAAIVFCGYCIQNGNTDSLQNGNTDPLFFLLGSIWLLLGGFAIHSRIYPDDWERSNTFYGITADRIMVCKSAAKPVVLSINFKSLKEVRLVQKSHGTGYILLGPNMPKLETMQNISQPYQLILQFQQTNHV
jgi:hypothetical protein